MKHISIRGAKMAGELGSISANDLDQDLYTSSRARERTLNAAILEADISQNFEAYLEIFDEFYSDNVEVASEPAEAAIRGKAEVRSIIANFLAPLHVMSEIGGVLVSVRQTTIPGDAADETHSAWTIEMVGISGRSCTVSWRALRKWNGSRVVFEYHYDHQQTGGPLTSDDLSFYGRTPAESDQRPS
jgi:hypothetical protein